MNTDKVYTSFLLKITDKLIPEDDDMKDLTIDEILSMIEEDLSSEEFLEYIEEGAYGGYIPGLLNNSESVKYFKPVEYHISIPSTACIKIEHVYIEEYTLYIQYKILDTPFGKFIYDNLKSGKIPCFAVSIISYINEETNKIIGLGIYGIDISYFI